jgi:putative heme-binding domain-containing protein
MRPPVFRFTSCLLALIVLMGGPGSRGDDVEAPGARDPFARENLVAWCIVPFDAQERSPAERAAMVKRLGLRRVAYDWRDKHVPTFEEEILEYQRHGIEYFAFWDAHPEALRLFRKYNLRPQIWKIMDAHEAPTQAERVRLAAEAMLPVVAQTRELGSRLGLYNHGGWAGEPQNLIAVCEYLREHHGADHVGIVYNLHHAHDHIEDFADVLKQMQPYLLCLNLNGMDSDGETIGRKILPLGIGEHDLALLKIIRDCGYRGPIGIIGHTQDDVEKRLQDNLDGLDWLLPQLAGKPAGARPKMRTTVPQATRPDNRTSGVLLEGRDSYRTAPLTIECRATLSDRSDYNILVASDTKASGAHWELFSMAGSGLLSAYLPGMQPDHVRSRAMICDGRPHTVAMLREPNRIRLVLDGQVVADQKVESLDRPGVPGGLGIGRLVEGTLGCRGAIEWVRLSKGIRHFTSGGEIDAAEDDTTLLLWRNDAGAAVPFPAALVQRVPEYSPEVVSAHVQQAQMEGRAERGLMLFSSAKLACLSCHKLGEHGGAVGPELTVIARQRKPAELVESVLWPNREVEPKYQAHLVITIDGKTHQGYLVERTPQQVTLRDPTRADAQSITLPVEEIDHEQPIGTLMPDNLVAAMSKQELDDLLAFVISLGSNDGLPLEEINAVTAHAQAHAHGPATFEYDRRPLAPEHWPSWQQHVNRDRIYDFYAKQAMHFRSQRALPAVLQEHPGLDGGIDGHWGNQSDEVWTSDRWNNTDLGSVHCGIFHGGGRTVPRGVCVRLGDNGEMSVCFNPETLTYQAAWTGGFVKFSSFRHGFLHGSLMDGTPAPLPEQSPPQNAEYLGFYRIGPRLAFAYRAGGIDYLDAPWVEEGRFVRTVAPASEHPLWPELQRAQPQWPQVFETRIEHGTGAPYAVDTIALPTDNPWKSQMFVGGLAFLPDGAALVCTMQGDVWRVEGFEYTSRTARWKRFAGGLHHALGLVVDEDGIFVLGRDQITRLHDLNGDHEADFYERFSNAFVTSPAGHDFICGLERDAAGNFYTASGNQGLLRISPAGKRVEVLATGFRNPDGLGVLPDGTVTVPCSEGEWTPASMICAVRPSEKPTFHGAGGPRDGQPPELPLVYLPRGVDNSAGGQTLVTSSQWGPLEGQLLHFSFGAGAHFLVLRDEVEGQLQGAVVPLPGEFHSGVHRGRFSPADSQLYVGGMQGWGSYTTDEGCFQRVRYTGGEVQLPIGFTAHENGVLLTFSAPLAPQAADPKSHFAQCWNYRYSAAYGSPEFSTRHAGMRGHDTLRITAAHFLDDGRRLLLEIPDLQPVNQLHLLVRVGDGVDRELFATVHRLGPAFDEFPGYEPSEKVIQSHPILADLAMATRGIPNPFTKPIDGARAVTIRTGTNLSYETREFRVQAGEAVQLTLVNPDVVPHNWALAKPGSLSRVGRLANQLIADPDAVVRQYIPESDDILVWTDVVLPREEFTISFEAPREAGRYPFLCTFPGHWLVMNGEMVVESTQ